MSWWSTLFRPAAAPEPFDDAVLGRLAYDASAASWHGRTDVGGVTLSFTFGLGPSKSGSPAPALLAHARDIVAEGSLFHDRITDFLEREARPLPEDVAHEVRSLGLDDVCLFWPERPDDGMLYFTVPGATEQDRVWRCDYVGRRPCGLGFDS